MIYSLDSVDSTESREKSPVAKYYPKYDLTPGNSDILAVHANHVLVPHVL